MTLLLLLEVYSVWAIGLHTDNKTIYKVIDNTRSANCKE